MKPSLLTPLAASLPATVPFVGPEAQQRSLGQAFRARLGANESLFGPSPAAIQAMQDASKDVWMYGDPELHDLTNALAKMHDCDPENIIVGEGIDGLLGYLVRLLIGPGDRVTTSLGAYPTFTFHVAGFGGEISRVPYKGDHEDPDALLENARAVGSKLIYLSNPDNPMGSHHPAPVIEAMIAQLADGCLMILDEAYIDLAPEGTAPKVDPNDPRVIRFRTFSKGYGMAGLRVGYAIGAKDLIKSFHKVRNHFGVGRIAQAGALAALADQAHLARVRDQVAQARITLADIAQQNGLRALPSATNFTCLDLGRNGDFARATLAALSTMGAYQPWRPGGVADLCRVPADSVAAGRKITRPLDRALQVQRQVRHLRAPRPGQGAAWRIAWSQ